MALASCAEKKQEATPPQQTIEAFKKMHPSAVITQWNDETPIWEAKFTEGSQQGAVSFDASNQVTETELVLPENELPNRDAILGFITKNYPGEKISSCEKISKSGSQITYEIQITGKELVFDSAGNFKNEEPD